MGTAKATREHRRSHFLCVGCGVPLKDREKNVYRNCHTCRDKMKLRNAKKNKQRYIRAKKAGVCVVCKSRLAMPKKTMCGFCSERKDEYRIGVIEFAAAAKMCICGNLLEDKTKKFCASCRAAGSRRSSKSWARKQEKKNGTNSD